MMKIEHKTPPRRSTVSSTAVVAERSGDPPPQFDSSDLGSPKKVWSVLCEKDESDKLRRDPNMFKRQHKINAGMRSMLFDWLMDVCSDKNMHRETFHLSMDYFDRYIALIDEQIEPKRLQLIGSTALVIATKIEEIYPPRIATIAEYSDGGCTEEDIVGMEEVMLERLDWGLYPITAVHWLALYLQLMNTSEVHPARQVILTAAKEAPSPNASGAISPDASFLHHHGPSPLSVDIVTNDENNGPWLETDEQPSALLHLDDHDEEGRGGEDEEEHGDEEERDALDLSLLPGSSFVSSVAASPFASSAAGPNNTSSASSARHISFCCSYPRMEVSMAAHGSLGASPRVLFHCVGADISCVGHNSYSSGHIYPDQRCTVPKLLRGEFVRMATILDLVMLDVGSLRFRYSELATGILLCCYEPEEFICQITGFALDQLREVRAYIEPYVQLFEQLEPLGPAIRCVPDVPHTDRHNIQCYSQNYLSHLEAVERKRKEEEARRKAVDQRVSARVRKRKFGSTPLAANNTAAGKV